MHDSNKKNSGESLNSNYSVNNREGAVETRRYFV